MLKRTKRFGMYVRCKKNDEYKDMDKEYIKDIS